MAGSLSAAFQIASSEPIDLIILDYDLLANNFVEAVSEAAKLMEFPRLILVANRDTWGPCDDAGMWGPPEILWKPLDPEILLGKILHHLNPARRG